jgi:hypothetical protein
VDKPVLSLRVAAVSLDCGDHEELARFYAGLLAGTLLWTREKSAAVESGGVVLVMQCIEGYQPPLNHAAHMTAVTQVRYSYSEGRAYFDKKIAEGKTPKEALRALKRQVSDAFYKHFKDDAARAAGGSSSPGGQAGNDSVASAAGSHPKTPALRPGHSRTKTHRTPIASARE